MPDRRTWRFRWCLMEPGHALHRVVGGRHVRKRFVGIVGGRTLCGKRGEFYMPGMFSRMGERRCAQCCRVAGIPWGYGAPFNALMGRLKNA